MRGGVGGRVAGACGGEERRGRGSGREERRERSWEGEWERERRGEGIAAR